MSKRSDILILGGGHNGLVCACYLASVGANVRVLERRSIVGGAAVTEEFHPGFRNSTASYTVGLLDPTVMQDLQLHEYGLRILTRPMANFLPLSDRESLSIYNEDDRSRNEISRLSVRDAEALPRYRSMLHEVGEVVGRLMRRPPPNLGGGLRDWSSMSLLFKDVATIGLKRHKNLADMFLSSAADVLSRWFENPHVQASMAFDAVVGNHKSLYSPRTAYGLLHHAIGETNGRKGVWGHAVGGMGAITQAMSKRASDLGVTIETDAEVVRVEIVDGRVRGAVLADGTTRRAETIAANLAPQQLYLDLVDDELLDIEFRRRVQNIRAESAVLRINVALSELPKFTCKQGDGIQDHHRAGIVFAPTLDYMEKAYLDSRSGSWSQRPVIELLIPSTIDDTLAPTGKHVGSLFCQHFPRKRDWDALGSDAAADVFATIDRYAPNFSRSVIAAEVFTPLDLERRFRLPGGDIFHVAHSLDQLWINRPLRGLAGYRGAFEGLYHCGAGAHPGGGVSGLPGRNAAKAILRDL